jgi:hypothetical protein
MSTIELHLEHPTDEQLVLFLDKELPPDERSNLREHLTGCITCAERLSDFEGASAGLRLQLAEMDQEIRIDELARARTLGAMRAAAARARPVEVEPTRNPLKVAAAAAAGFILVASLSVSPLAAWIGGWFARSSEVVEVPVGVVSEPISPIAGPIFSFRPTDSTFRIELDQLQASGVLTIELAAEELAQAQILDAAEEAIVVLPAGIRIENTSAATASYRVLLPPSVARYEVVANGVLISQNEMASLAAPESVNLAAPAER